MEIKLQQRSSIILSYIFYGSMITVNALANIVPINGKNTGELSAYYPNLFVPAGITFSIWGIIYLFLFCFLLYNVYLLKINKETGLIFKDYLLFYLTCVLNLSWILAWHYQFVLLSVLIMLSLLLTLINLVLRLDKLVEKSILFNLCVRIPFSIYLAWISVATIANFTAFLVYINWDRFGISEINLTLLVLSVSFFLAMMMLKIKKNIPYALVIIWAYFGIIIKRKSEIVQIPEIINFCYAAIIVLLIYISFNVINRKKV